MTVLTHDLTQGAIKCNHWAAAYSSDKTSVEPNTALANICPAHQGHLQPLRHCPVLPYPLEMYEYMIGHQMLPHCAANHHFLGNFYSIGSVHFRDQRVIVRAKYEDRSDMFQLGFIGYRLVSLRTVSFLGLHFVLVPFLTLILNPSFILTSSFTQAIFPRVTVSV